MESAPEGMAVLQRGDHTVGLDWGVIMNQTVKTYQNSERLPWEEDRRSGSMEKMVHDAEAREGRRANKMENGDHCRWGQVGEQQKANLHWQTHSDWSKDQRGHQLDGSRVFLLRCVEHLEEHDEV